LVYNIVVHSFTKMAASEEAKWHTTKKTLLSLDL